MLKVWSRFLHMTLGACLSAVVSAVWAHDYDNITGTLLLSAVVFMFCAAIWSIEDDE